jgi:protein-tyrosine phosphatase
VQAGGYKLLFEVVQHKPAHMYHILRTLIHAPQAAWYYCRIGSERSGLISALLLDVVGVPHDIIIADYTRTAIYAAPLIEQLRREVATHYPEYIDKVNDVIWPRPETMQIFLYLLQQKFGSGAGYLQHIGISADEIAQLRAKFVVDAAFMT